MGGGSHPANSLLTNCKNGGSGRDGTLPRGQDATHAGQQQHVRMRRLPLPQCQRRTRRQDGREGGTLARASSPPQGTPDPAEHWPPSGQKNARSAKRGRRIAPGTGRARARRRSPRARLSRSSASPASAARAHLGEGQAPAALG